MPWAYHNWTVGRGDAWRPVAMLLQILGDTLWLLGSAFAYVQHGANWTVFGYFLYGPQVLLVGWILALKIRALLTSCGPDATDTRERHANVGPSL